MTVLHGKKIVFPDHIGEGYIYIDGGKIISVGKKVTDFSPDRVIDCDDGYIMPGLIDIHTHGALGFDFCECTPDESMVALGYHLSHGATSVMPTITSSSFDKTYKALENIERAMTLCPERNNIIGVHLEGPYLSVEQCGAQDKSLITEPVESDYRRIVERFGSIIKRWDFAPERDSKGAFCRYLNNNNILPSAGHTDAKYDDMLIARENGCRLITHFYSCMSTITREMGFRKLGVIECGYLWDDMYIEIIADGKHLPSELIKLIFKLKDNNKIILVSDSLKVAGSKEKYSSVGNTKCVIEDGVCKLLDRSAFAGSIASADTLIKVSVASGIPLLFAVKAATENPVRLFSLNKGRLESGYDADICITDDNLNIKRVLLNGEYI